MKQIKSVTSTAIPLLLDDIDTDRIIPARYLRCVSFDGLGDHAFRDDREHDPSHPFNHEHHREAGILVTGRNFGCGSSREHAPQSLMRWGIEAIIAESHAEIFFGNCTSLGIPAVTADRKDLEILAEAVQADPNLEVTVDLENQTITFGDQLIACSIPESARGALVTGQWDFLGQLLENVPAIEEKRKSLPYLNGYTA